MALRSQPYSCNPLQSRAAMRNNATAVVATVILVVARTFVGTEHEATPHVLSPP